MVFGRDESGDAPMNLLYLQAGVGEGKMKSIQIKPTAAIAACAMIIALMMSAYDRAANSAEYGLTICGVRLGEPLDVPECPQDAAGHYALIMTNRDSICAPRKNVIHKAWGSDDIDLEFPNNSAPDYIRRGNFAVSLLEGKVESIAFATNGLSSQASVLHALEEKFGKPSRLRPEIVQNAFGAKYSRVNAIWNRPAVRIELEGATHTDWGRVEISTSRYEAAIRPWDAQQKAKSPKM
jgi:hypothetical protein